MKYKKHFFNFKNTYSYKKIYVIFLYFLQKINYEYTQYMKYIIKYACNHTCYIFYFFKINIFYEPYNIYYTHLWHKKKLQKLSHTTYIFLLLCIKTFFLLNILFFFIAITNIIISLFCKSPRINFIYNIIP